MTTLSYDTPMARPPLFTRKAALRGYRSGMALLTSLAFAAVVADAFCMSGLEFLAMLASLWLGISAFAVCAFVVCWTGPGLTRRVILLVLLPLVMISVWRLHWPLRLTFGISSGQLNQLAASVKAGKAPALPARTGCFVVDKAELRGANVCLWLRGSSQVRFLQCPPGTTAAQVNPWTEFPLDASWHYVGGD